MAEPIVRLMETHMSDRALCRKKVREETECFKEDGGNLSDLPRAILARHELALKMRSASFDQRFRIQSWSEWKSCLFTSVANTISTRDLRVS